jgi:hypothetical protein
MSLSRPPLGHVGEAEASRRLTTPGIAPRNYTNYPHLTRENSLFPAKAAIIIRGLGSRERFGKLKRQIMIFFLSREIGLQARNGI